MEALLTRFDTRGTAPRRSDRRAERRRLARCDALSSRLAELHRIEAVLAQAREVIGGGWVQSGWFRVGTPEGQVVVTTYDIGLLDEHPVTGACLVGAVVHAAGGPANARSQLAQRTLDVTWHALREEFGPQRRLSPSPQVRTLRMLDLTRWNDARGRTRAEVVDLFSAARNLADALGQVCRAEQEALAPA